MLNKPDWPAAEVFLTLLGKLLVSASAVCLRCGHSNSESAVSVQNIFMGTAGIFDVASVGHHGHVTRFKLRYKIHREHKVHSLAHNVGGD